MKKFILLLLCIQHFSLFSADLNNPLVDAVSLLCSNNEFIELSSENFICSDNKINIQGSEPDLKTGEGLSVECGELELVLYHKKYIFYYGFKEFLEAKIMASTESEYKLELVFITGVGSKETLKEVVYLVTIDKGDGQATFKKKRKRLVIEN